MKTPLRHDTTALPILLAMLATGLLTLMDGLLKAVVGRASTIDVVFLRYLFGLVATVPILFFVRPPWLQAALAAFGLGLAAWMYRLPSRDK